MRTTPSGRCGRGLRSSRPSRSSKRRAASALQVRIGIATGIVVVGDLVGQGSAQEQAVVGETPNLAARLQALAEPGSVVIAEATRRLLGGAFELKPLGPQTLEGLRRAGSRLGGRARSGERQPLRGVAIARHDAVRRTRARGRAAPRALARRGRRRGPGRAALGRGRHRQVAHSGDAARADRRRAARRDALSMLAASRQRRVLSDRRPDLARGGLRRRRAGGDAARQAGGDDRALAASTPKEIAPLLASLLSIPAEGRYPALEMAPSEQKERTIAALIDLFEGLTQGRAGAGAAGGRALDRPDLARRVRSARSIDCRGCGRCWLLPSAPSSRRPGSAAPMSRRFRSTASGGVRP